MASPEPRAIFDHLAVKTRPQAPRQNASAEFMPCPVCARQLSPAAQACPGCGHPLKAQPWAAAPTPNPGVAAVLSLVLPGAGQFYRGMLGWGFFWVCLVPLAYFLFLPLGLILHVFCIMSAYS